MTVPTAIAYALAALAEQRDRCAPYAPGLSADCDAAIRTLIATEPSEAARVAYADSYLHVRREHALTARA